MITAGDIIDRVTILIKMDEKFAELFEQLKWHNVVQWETEAALKEAQEEGNMERVADLAIRVRNMNVYRNEIKNKINEHFGDRTTDKKDFVGA